MIYCSHCSGMHAYVLHSDVVRGYTCVHCCFCFCVSDQVVFTSPEMTCELHCCWFFYLNSVAVMVTQDWHIAVVHFMPAEREACKRMVLHAGKPGAN